MHNNDVCYVCGVLGILNDLEMIQNMCVWVICQDYIIS